MSDDDTIQSVSRALAILDAVAARPSTRAQPLANVLGLSLPTTYHLLKTLAVAGYLTKDERAYRLGPKVAMLSASFERDLRPDSVLYAATRRLANALGETVYVSRWIQGDVVISSVIEGVQALRVAGVHVGLRGHAYARASGKVLLAFGSSERLQSYLAAAPLAALTPNTKSSHEALQAELEETRDRGYAIDREEFALGVCCIAAPVSSDRLSEVSTALTVSMPASRFVEVRDRSVRALLNAVAVAVAQGTRAG